MYKFQADRHSTGTNYNFLAFFLSFMKPEELLWLSRRTRQFSVSWAR
jgi:hypothetical protein